MERVWSTSRRGLSARSILTFALTVFMTALLWVTFGNHTLTYAADPTASWKGNNILYNGNEYFPAGNAAANDSIGLPEGTPYYIYIPTSTNQTNTSTPPTTQKAYVIYFTSGTDPPKEKTASFATYDYSSSKVFSNPTDKQAITITPKGSESSYSSCTIQGVGWIICPVTTFLADGMDNIFNIMKGFLVVQPAKTTNTGNDLYTAWNIMRSIANVAFIIVFLIIIYSQLTNIGISNYGLKKLLPRLIVAAVLVNLSYFISSIAVDLSNILGYSLQDIFVQIRQNTFNINNDTWANTNGMGWSAIAAFVLSGGAATIGLIAATGGTVAGAIYLLVPVLIGLLLTILAVLLILAARQAIIIILIVVAPLAFVAYLLPNTEQWFKKWRELFTTMLVFFPAFSLVFGGSQLAGGLIIQNATNIFGVIFGMAVQVAPLAISPLLLRLSGGLLGKIAGIINAPKKGLMDRTKSWSADSLAMHKQQGLRDDKLRWYNGARRIARAMDNSKRRVKDRTALYTSEADNRYHRSKGYVKLHKQMFEAEQEKNIVDNTLKEHIQQEINSRGSQLHLQNLQLEDLKQRVEVTMKETETQIEEYRSGRVAVTGELSQITHSLRSSHEELALSAIRRKSAHDVIEDNWTTRFIREDHLQILAGGVGGQKAANVALASAIATEFKAHDENVAAARSLASYFKLSVDQRNELANGRAVVGRDSNGTIRQFTPADIYTREVAIVDTIKAAPYGMGAAIIKNASSADYAPYRNVIAEAMEAGNWETKGAYFDGETRDAVRQGIADEAYLKQRAAEFLVNGKLSAELMATHHKNSLQTYIDVRDELLSGRITVADDKFAVGNLDPAGHGDINVALERVKKQAHIAATDVRIKPRTGDRKDAIEKIDETF
ncbi:MAG: hypothetical protein EOT05_01590 [Candidatus Microsaccharimonas sossegonensis]|uniref:Uncharacterized protein n=1 Tax=Candidatus Microsaccharimonas sossegonensis TaxID=2506948 RepID=A0A4Q0AH63_9BACT|nr:MAG: hypothetical protein EOT05_01590 [Candidatus Microsaccharimonas sossegonensis]